MNLTPELGRLRYPIMFVLSLGLGLYFTPQIRKVALRYGIVDRPDGSLKAHQQPTPYLGGLAIFLAFLFSTALTYEFTHQVLGLLLAATIIVATGLFDDLKVLSPRAKLVGQIIAAFVLIKAEIMIQLSFLPLWATLLLTVLWLVGVTNAINLIDVSDGLAAGVASIAGMFLYIVSLWNGHTTIAMLTLALVGASLGFLAYNRAPARIFLGDTGSMFLGFMLAALAMSGHYTFQNRLGAFAPAVVLGVPIFDTLFVMGIRWARGIPLMQGSPDHFAVRLRRHGASAGLIALVAYLASIVLGVAALWLCQTTTERGAIILAGLAALALATWVALVRLGRGPTAKPTLPPARASVDAPPPPEPDIQTPPTLNPDIPRKV